ncbi:MAG: hypothetical protein IJW66_05210 [Clostridia bacterium]|nr:hypothetical protein [Clostridia bacterium]
MKRKILLFVTFSLLFAVFALSSCGILSKLNGAVKYPDAYSITYEVTSGDGRICTVKKTVDADGSVYVKSGDVERVYINDNGKYTLYERSEMGDFEAVGNDRYTETAVKAETAVIEPYAEETKKQFIPTAKLDGEGEILGRACDVYKIGVGTENNSSYYYYYVEREYGICLSLEVKNTALGEEVASNSETFICTEFITEGIEDLSNLISK